MSRGREFFDLVLPGMTVELRCVACGAWFRWTAGRTVNDPPSHCSDRCRKRHHQILAMVDADRSLCPRPEKRVYLSHADAERACNRIRRHAVSVPVRVPAHRPGPVPYPAGVNRRIRGLGAVLSDHAGGRPRGDWFRRTGTGRR